MRRKPPRNLIFKFLSGTSKSKMLKWVRDLCCSFENRQHKAELRDPRYAKRADRHLRLGASRKGRVGTGPGGEAGDGALGGPRGGGTRRAGGGGTREGAPPEFTRPYEHVDNIAKCVYLITSLLQRLNTCQSNPTAPFPKLPTKKLHHTCKIFWSNAGMFTYGLFNPFPIFVFSGNPGHCFVGLRRFQTWRILDHWGNVGYDESKKKRRVIHKIFMFALWKKKKAIRQTEPWGNEYTKPHGLRPMGVWTVGSGLLLRPGRATSWGKRSIPSLGDVGNNSGRHGGEGSFCGANKWTETKGSDGGTLVFFVTNVTDPL